MIARSKEAESNTNGTLDTVFAELGRRGGSIPSNLPVPTSPRSQEISRPPDRPFAYQPRSRDRAPAAAEWDWFSLVLRTMCVISLAFSAVFFYRAMPSSWRTSIISYYKPDAARAGFEMKVIEDVRVGERIEGHNPLRSQVDIVEPEPATWRKLDLRMTKESGGKLWIELLRPVDWIEEHHAEVGDTIFLDLYEMGAVGDAEVTYLGPCPEIPPGTGTVVTGTYKHEVDQNSRVVHLEVESESEPGGVTENHPYWSVDRGEFVAVGQLRSGELIDTLGGLKRVVSVTPMEYSGFLYNLETTEHVFRVGNLGAMVHNNCDEHHPVPKFLGGDEAQVLSRLDPQIHQEFHSLLRQNLRAAGLPLNVGGRGGSRVDWARYMNANPGAQRSALDAVLDASRTIDARHGTSITQDVWDNLVNGRFRVR